MSHRAWLRLPALVIASLGFAAGLFAESSVWKVTKGDSVVYLGGTCHLLRPADFPLPKEFDAAYAAADALYFETDLARLNEPAIQRQLLTRGMFADGEGSLEQALDPEAWKALQDYCAQSGLPLEQLQSFRPWLLVVMISIGELQKAGVTQEGVDAYYFKRASSDRKTCGALEEVEQHLRYVTTMGVGHESDLVKNTLTELAALPAIFETLVGAWRTGDIAKVDELMMREIREKYPALYQQLVVDRNRLWVPRVEEMLRTPQTEFVLVGFLHLAGETGLVAALRQRGYQVELLAVKN
jgi:uncharacterized protein YbaP (TraB family)